MITEQELNDAGAGQYLTLVEHIREIIRDHGKDPMPKHLLPTKRRTDKSKGVIAKKREVKPPEDREDLYIPITELEKIDGLKLKESLEYLTKDSILRKFRNIRGSLVSGEEVYGVYRQNWRVDQENESIMVYRRLNIGVKEIDQYIDEVRSIVAPKPESGPNTKRLRLEFEDVLGIMSYGIKNYKPHQGKGGSGEKLQLALLKKLWPKRKRVGGSARFENKLPKPTLSFDLKL
jgi:hypothetical protein